MSQYRYGSYGSVRGYGRLFSALAEAERDVRRDGEGCAKQGGYSDRQVVAVDEDGICYAVDGNGDPTHWIPGSGGRGCGAARYTDEDLASVRA